MSTLDYLDEGGSVNFRFVPWKLLNDWLSELNGNNQVTGKLREGVNRGKVLEELDQRRSKPMGVVDWAINRGHGSDWREFENEQGYTHFEELLIHQPKDWRKQAREYFYRFNCNLERGSALNGIRTAELTLRIDGQEETTKIFLRCPSLVVLLHPEMKRSMRYQPLIFLLAYGVHDPIPSLQLEPNIRAALVKELSPLDYSFYFQENVQGYALEKLREIGRMVKVRRLSLIKELDFCDIIGQRMAKHMIRFETVDHLWKRADRGQMCSDKRPLSMIFAGPSGNGITEMAHWLSDILNKPGDDSFLKIDCGKLQSAGEVFGLSGAYQGATEGSALNNFVLRLSMEPDAFGIILLDEIEKANREVIHGLYQVLDKGEWTNKKVEQGRAQTIAIPCHNLIFIMTTNAADTLIIDAAASKNVQGILDRNDFDDASIEIESLIRKRLQHTYPFTDAFIGRVGRIVPFFPMANADLEENMLMGEMMVVAKLLIEREQERADVSGTFHVEQLVTPKEKHRMSQIIVHQALPEAGVRSIHKVTGDMMGKRMRHSLLLEKGGIKTGAQVR